MAGASTAPVHQPRGYCSIHATARPTEARTALIASSSTTAPPASLTARLARTPSVVAVALLFAVNALIIGGYGGALPSIREPLDLTATHIAVLLFTAGLAGIVAKQIGGRLADALGARHVALVGLALLVAAVTTFAPGNAFPVAVVAAVLIGLGNRRHADQPTSRSPPAAPGVRKGTLFPMLFSAGSTGRDCGLLTSGVRWQRYFSALCARSATLSRRRVSWSSRETPRICSMRSMR